MKVLVTGGSGFIGRALCQSLVARGDVEVRCVTRAAVRVEGVTCEEIGSIDAFTDWMKVLSGVDSVVHLAGLAHSSFSEAEFERVNVEGSVNLARQAIEAGVKRFIFISSIGVNGAQSACPFRWDDTPSPEAIYAQSKHKAEIRLSELVKGSEMELVIVRPPMVYGPSAPGNFKRLVSLINRQVPLPLGAVANKKSFVSIYNLVDFLVVCLNHPRAGGNIFLVSDDDDVSTPQFLRYIAEEMGRPAVIFPVPVGVLAMVLKLAGQKSLEQSLLRSLEVDIEATKKILDWSPKYSVRSSLKKVFRETTRSSV